MVNEISYLMPTRIIYGEDSINNIDEYINNRKTLLVTSKSFVSRGLVSKIKSLTRHIVHVVADIESHPGFAPQSDCRQSRIVKESPGLSRQYVL